MFRTYWCTVCPTCTKDGTFYVCCAKRVLGSGPTPPRRWGMLGCQVSQGVDGCVNRRYARTRGNVQLLCKRGAGMSGAVYYLCQTQLVAASLVGRPLTVKRLCEAGSNPSVPDLCGVTTLLRTANDGDFISARELLSANPSAATYDIITLSLQLSETGTSRSCGG